MLSRKDNHSNKSLFLGGLYRTQDVSDGKYSVGSNGDLGKNILRKFGRVSWKEITR